MLCRIRQRSRVSPPCLPAADGSVVWLELSAVQIDWEDAPATLSFITDITERRRLKEGLKQTLAERDTILDNSIVGILFLDRDRRVRWANSAMAAMFGMSRMLEVFAERQFERTHVFRDLSKARNWLVQGEKAS